MEQVQGIGGVFLRARDKQASLEWYQKNLGIPVESWGGTVFSWQTKETPPAPGTTSWSLFDQDSDYLGPRDKACMVNYRVENLDRMLEQLRAAGVTVDDKIDESEFGRFGWAEDPDGNRIELWEPPDGM